MLLLNQELVAAAPLLQLFLDPFPLLLEHVVQEEVLRAHRAPALAGVDAVTLEVAPERAQGAPGLEVVVRVFGQRAVLLVEDLAEVWIERGGPGSSLWGDERLARSRGNRAHIAFLYRIRGRLDIRLSLAV